LQFRLSDRFGDNGLVSVMQFRRDPNSVEAMELVNWVMSCRVFGRQLEHEAMNIAVEAARRRGMSTLSAEYVPSAKNGVVSDLFPRLGFTADVGRVAHGGSRWTLDLGRYSPHRTHIRSKPGES
jgi:FkbH-like protein